MVDPLRRNLERIIDECPNIVLEGDDLQLLRNGQIDKLINRDKREDEVIDSVVSELDSPDENVDVEIDVKSDQEIDLDEGEVDEESEKGEDTRNFGLF